MRLPTETKFVAVAVTFSKSPKSYFYLAPASMGLKPGDRVLVRNGASFTIPTVESVDATCEGLDMSLISDWVVQKVDTTEYGKLVAETADAAE